MRDLVISLIVFGAVPFMLRRPHIGVLVWSWLGYMNPHRLSWGFAYSFPFAQVVAIATLIGLIFSGEPKRVPWTALTAVWLLFVFWMCVSTMLALEPGHSVWEWERTMKTQLMIFVTLLTMGSRDRINALLWVMVVSIGFFGVKGGIFTILKGGEFLVWGPPESYLAGNNEIALALVVIFPLMRYLHLNTANKWVRWGLLVSMLLIVVSIIGSYSRGAFLAVSAMGAFLLLKSDKRLILVGMVALAIPLALVFMPAHWAERMTTIKTYEQDASAVGRINAWNFAVNLAQDRPLAGGGFDVFQPQHFEKYLYDTEDFDALGYVEGKVPDSHSIYFEVLAEHGFVGLALFLTMGLLILHTGRKVTRRARGSPELKWAGDLAGMIQVGFVGYAVGGAFLGLAYLDLPYHLMAILILTSVLVSRQTQPAAELARQATLSKSAADPA